MQLQLVYTDGESELHRTTFAEAGAFGKEAVVSNRRLVLLHPTGRVSFSLEKLRSVGLESGSHPGWAVALILLAHVTAWTGYSASQMFISEVAYPAFSRTSSPTSIAILAGGAVLASLLLLGAWQCFRGYTKLALDFDGEKLSLTLYRQDPSLFDLAQRLEGQLGSAQRPPSAA